MIDCYQKRGHLFLQSFRVSGFVPRSKIFGAYSIWMAKLASKREVTSVLLKAKVSTFGNFIFFLWPKIKKPSIPSDFYIIWSNFNPTMVYFLQFSIYFLIEIFIPSKDITEVFFLFLGHRWMTREHFLKEITEKIRGKITDEPFAQSWKNIIYTKRRNI